MLKSITLISTAAILSAASLALGGDRSAERYVKRQIPQGGNRYGIVLVPVGDRLGAAEAPYALTGRDTEKSRRPVVSPLHPRGPRSW